MSAAARRWMADGKMTIVRFGGALLATTLGLGLAAACGSDDGQRVNDRENQAPGGAGVGPEAGAGGSSNVSGSPAIGGAAGQAPTSGGAAGEAPVSGGAAGEAPVSGGAAGADTGNEAGAAGVAGAGGSGELPTDLSLLGCRQVVGERPASSNVPAAPQVADLQLDPTDPGDELSGSLAFQDTDAKELLVQVGGKDVHYVCPLSEQNLAAKVAELSPLSLNPAFPEGSRLVYFGVRDLAGNVSSYLVGSLAVGQGADPGIDVCEAQPSVQLMGAIPSASTAFYQQANGFSADYRVDFKEGEKPVLIGSTRVHVNLGECTKLRLAGNASGTKPLGWDNCLVVEYRPTVGGNVANVWSFCGVYGSVFSLATNELVPVPLRPTLLGNVLEPPVPSQLLFGYAPLAIDLASLIPSTDKNFELSLHVLDFGGSGSTTEIWALSGDSQ